MADGCQALPSLSGRSWGCPKEAHTITVSQPMWSRSSRGSVYSWYERGKSSVSKSGNTNACLKHLLVFFFFFMIIIPGFGFISDTKIRVDSSI